MNIAAFAQEVARMQERFDGMQRRAGGLVHPEVASEAMQELSTSLEELRVAEEELRVQNEALMAAREDLEGERRRYHDLFDLAPDGYIVTDAAGTVTDANRAAARFLRCEQPHLRGKPLAARVPEGDRGMFRAQLDRIASGERVDAWPLALWAPAGGTMATIHLSITAEPGRDPLTGARIIRWIMRDVTERVRLEQGLREADEKLWIRVVERTHDLTAENERLRLEVARLKEPVAKRGGGM